MVSPRDVYDEDIWANTQTTLGQTFLGLSKEKGFGDYPGLPQELDFLAQAKDIALIQSECTEMLEALRLGPIPEVMSAKTPAFTLIEEEAADVYIRLLEFCARNQLNLTGAVMAKHGYNATRTKRHGGKQF